MTVFSKFADEETAKIRAQLREKEAIWPPPISFDDMSKCSKKKGKKDTEKSTDDLDDKKDTKVHEFEIRLDLDDPDSDTHTKKVRVFENGRPFDWCVWREKFDALLTEMGVTRETDIKVQAQKRHKLCLTTMGGKCLEKCQEAHEKNFKLNRTWTSFAM